VFPESFRSGLYAGEVTIAPRSSWTFLHYLNGDNNLRESVTHNLARLHAEGSSDQVQVVATLFRGQEEGLLARLGRRFFGTAQATASATDWRGQRTFAVRPENSAAGAASPLLAEGERRPSDWRNLRDTLIESMEAYPAQHYALCVSSHGAGEEGLLRDGQGRRMSVDDFCRALREAEEVTGGSIDMVALEACSMGQPSVISKLGEVTDYVIASPVPIATHRVAHEQLLAEAKAHPHWSPAEMAGAAQRVYAQELPAMQLFTPRSL
jgi:hypothetical protein